MIEGEWFYQCLLNASDEPGSESCVEEEATLEACSLESTNLSLSQSRQIYEADSPKTYCLAWETSCSQVWFHPHLALHSLAGPVVSILGYEVHGDVTLKIGISTNNTQCVNLQVQDKDIKVKKVTLQITDMYVRPFFSFSRSMCAKMSPVIPPLEMEFGQSNGLNN